MGIHRRHQLVSASSSADHKPITRPAPKNQADAPVPGIISDYSHAGLPTADRILGMQRTVGNQAVLRRIKRTVIQRAQLPAADTYQTLDLADARLVAVGDAAVAYNAVADLTSEVGYQQRFNLLQTVERAIYAWYAEVSRTNQRLSAAPHQIQVEALRTAVDTEHETLVTATKDMINILPLDTRGMLDIDVIALKTLWQSIVNSQGKVKVSGSAGYKQRVLSELSRILSTPTGRAMLKFLNTPPPGEVIGSEEAALTNIYIGESIDILPLSVRLASPKVKNENRSEAQPLNITDVRKVEDLTGLQPVGDAIGDEDEAEYPTVESDNLKDIQTSSWGGGKGFIHGGKKYNFNVGKTGAYVTSFPGLSLIANQAGNEIMSPGWVTMGHELGHTANMRSGATTLQYKPAVGDTLTGSLLGDNEGAKKWDNAEELLNIQNVENSLRSESGLDSRSGHQTPQFAIDEAVRKKAQLRVPLNGLTQEDGLWTADPEWARVNKAVGLVGAKQIIDDPNVMINLQQQVTQFMLTVPPLVERQNRKLGRDGIINQMDQMEVADATWTTDQEFRALRYRLRNSAISQLTVGAMIVDFRKLLLDKANALLPGYLRSISDSDAKSQTLMDCLLTNDEKIIAMKYLHARATNLGPTKTHLHFGYKARKGTTEQERAQTRITRFRNLVGI